MASTNLHSDEYLRSNKVSELRAVQRAKLFKSHGVAGWAGRAFTDVALRPMGRAAGRMGRAAWEMKIPVGKHTYRATKAVYRGAKRSIPAAYRFGVRPVAVKTGKSLAREIKHGFRIAKHLPVFSAAFTGYEISQGKNLAEGLMRGGVEAAAIQAASVAGSFGAGVGSIGGPVGSLAGGIVFGGLAYFGTHAIGSLGLKRRKEDPVFENVYMNRRASTMRQASQMHLAKSSRAAFGNEASLMHLR